MRELPPPYVTNERYKSLSRVLFQLGTALSIAAGVKSYSDQDVGPEAILWILLAAALMWGGWQILSLLEPEK